MVICDDLFDRSHHKSNKANAFRHALWNILICQKNQKQRKICNLESKRNRFVQKSDAKRTFGADNGFTQ